MAVQDSLSTPTSEVVGRMLRFNKARDQCFLVPLGRSGMRDILLWRSVLIRSGVTEIPPAGSYIRCRVEETDRGPRAVEVLSIAQAAPINAGDTEAVETMTLKFFIPDERYGFFTRSNGGNVHASYQAFERGGLNWRVVKKGQVYSVTFGPGPRGPMASKVTEVK